ncbi:MAG: patatin-like phospholipase family protein, partial [Pseudolabrys sp.]
MIDFQARASRGSGGGKPDKPRGYKRFNLALQGGGTHGAFTWGVLDHLLEDGRLAIEGISGTSAGAVNAVMLAEGLRRGARPAVLAAADLARPRLVRRLVAVALRSQSAQRQSAQGADRALRGFRWAPRRPAPALHRRNQRADRAAAHLLAGEDFRRGGDGL